jgi:hypothetical protein
VPTDAFTQEIADGKAEIRLGAAIIGFNHFGRPTGHVAQELIFSLSNVENLKTAKLTFDQHIDLPKGEDFLFIALWDISTGRLGMLQLPLDVEKKK